MVDQKIRSFLAIELNNALVKEASFFVQQIKDKNSSFRFIPHQNWHLTLHFFGSLSPEKVDRLNEHLPSIFAQTKPFHILFSGFGGFPTNERSRILWLGVKDETNQLLILKEQLDRALLKMNFPIETRSYHPHITIARAQKLEFCNFAGFEKNEFKAKAIVEKVSLFKSTLTSSGPEYVIIQSFHFLNS